MEIRYAREADIPRLGELLLQVCRVHREGRPDLFREGGRKYTDEELKELLRTGDVSILVAEADGLVAGYAFCFLEKHKKGAFQEISTLYLDDLCVDENCRGRGVGEALYKAVLNMAKAAGCYNVTLNVWASNDSARRFYEKMGLQVQKLGMEKIL